MTARETPAGSNGRPVDWAAELERHGRWLRTVVFARLGDRSGVEDVLQEVSLAALEQKAPLQNADKVPAWLYQLAVRQALLYRRRHGRERKRVERWAERKANSESDPAAADPLGWLLAGERQRFVREALSRLDEEDREILLLKYTEDWSYRDLAGRLGVSTSAIEARLHRARQRLRHQLALLNVTEREP